MTLSLYPRSVAGVTLLQTVALVPPLLVAAWTALADVALIIVVAALTALVWEMVFTGIRKRASSFHGITTALIVTLFCPAEIALWQLAVAVSLGVVLGELIFGGRGFGFVSPAALTLSVLINAFPEVALRAPTEEIALAVVPGLVLLYAAGLVSLSVLGGVGVGFLALLAVSGQVVDPVLVAIALSVGAVFLICDPTAASVTAVGRWVYGLFAGALIFVFSSGSGVTPEAVVAAALLASVAAPLIDHGAVLLHMRSRRIHRHG